MIAITTSSSISVNLRVFMAGLPLSC